MSSVDFLADLGPSEDVRAVARVLSAAAAPPWPHELRGYESARRAFESAGSVGSAGAAGTVGAAGGAASAGKAGTGATPVRHTYAVPLRRLLGVKLAAVAGALTVTGVAVAAEADVLPSPIQRAAHQVLGGVGVPDPDPAARAGRPLASSPDSSSAGSAGSASPNSVTSDHASDGHSGGGTSTGGGGLAPGTPAGTLGSDPSGQNPSTSAADALTLCRAYTAHQGGDAADGGNGNGNANGSGGLNDQDRRRLAQLAGGEDKVDAFCAQVLGAAATTGGPVAPQPSGHSTPPSAIPDPSHDHKPPSSAGPSDTSSTPDWNPATSGTGDGGGNGHGHSPNPSHTGH